MKKGSKTDKYADINRIDIKKIWIDSKVNEQKTEISDSKSIKNILSDVKFITRLEYFFSDPDSPSYVISQFHGNQLMRKFKIRGNYLCMNNEWGTIDKSYIEYIDSLFKDIAVTKYDMLKTLIEHCA